MNSRIQNLIHKLRSQELLANPLAVSLALLLVTLVSYALVIPRLGFYWDSWPMNWIAQTRGLQGLAQYFSTNRPVWGLLYQITLPALGNTPLPYQIMALILRWWMSIALWNLLRLLWPRHPEPALWTTLFFLVYPGFQQHSIGLLYSHFYIVLTAFLVSLACSLLELKYPRRRWLFLILGLLLSAMNLFMMEYFFLLELLRPFLVWIGLENEPEGSVSPLARPGQGNQEKDLANVGRSPSRQPVGKSFLAWIQKKRFLPRLGRVFLLWAPYLALFLAAAIWRAFLFPYQTNNYSMNTLSQLADQPLITLLRLVGRAGEQIGIVTLLAWFRAGGYTLDKVSATRYTLVVISSIILLFLSGIVLKSERQPSRADSLRWSKQAILLAGLALGLAGWPFWLTGVPFGLQFAYDRFTLPYMFGVCLLLAGLLVCLPWRSWRWLIMACLVSLGIGFQYQAALAFRQDWVYQQQFFWQFTWRIPHLQPGTLLIVNENQATAYSTDNSLSAPLNWIYDPANSSQDIRHLMVYPTIRRGLSLQENTPIREDLLVGVFQGNTSRSVSLFYDGVNCLRVLDPILDARNPAIEDALRQTMRYSDLTLIHPLSADETARPPLLAILGQPPERSWCKTYENADLLRQLGQWQKILQLWENDQDLFSASRNPAEAAPFIEAYARSGQWEPAAQLTRTTLNSRPILCSLWQYLDQTTPPDAAKHKAVGEALNLLKCEEYGIFPQKP